MNIQVGHDALIESKKQLITGTYLRNAWYWRRGPRRSATAACSASPS